MENNLGQILGNGLPLVLLVLVYVFILKRFKGANAVQNEAVRDQKEIIEEVKKTNQLLAEISQKLDKH